MKKTNIGGNLKMKRGYFGIGFENINSTGFAKNTAFDRTNILLKSGWNILENTELNFSFGRFENEFGAANFYSPTFYKQFEKVASNLGIVQLKHNIGNSFTSSITASHRRHYDYYDFDNYRKTKPSSVNVHQTDVNDITWINKLISNFGTTSIGLEYRSEAVISNRLGDLLSSPKNVTVYGSDTGNLQYTKGKTRQNTSAYFEQFKQWDKATLTFGTLLNFNTQFGTNWYPGADFSYAINSKSNIYTSVNRSLRFPTFTEMYLIGATVIGDPNLKPEEAWTFEIGTKRNTKSSQLVMAAFYKHSNSAIDKVKRPEKAVPTMETIGDMNTRGVEFSYLLNINQLTGNLNSILKNVKLNFAIINADKKEAGYQSFYTLNYLKNKGSIGMNWRLANNLSLDTWYTYKDRAGLYQWDAKTKPVDYEPINLVDARLNFQQKHYRIFVDGTNLLNRSYYEFGFVEQPRRWISAGFSITVK